jgi:hypothetical protein
MAAKYAIIPASTSVTIARKRPVERRVTKRARSRSRFTCAW